MREKKFTPGPWEVKTFEGGLTDIMALHHSHWAVAEQVLQKDANLIAAAPELLEALEGLLLHYTSMVDSGDCGSWDPEEDEDVVQSRIAIAKVYGE